MTTTRVRAHEREREGKHEHVREHVRKVQGGAGGAEKPNPEDYEGIGDIKQSNTGQGLSSKTKSTKGEGP
jgi:hypothetical protein